MEFGFKTSLASSLYFTTPLVENTKFWRSTVEVGSELHAGGCQSDHSNGNRDTKDK